MSFSVHDAQIRRDNCTDCGEGCQVDPNDPCAACYRHVWNAWGNCAGEACQKAPEPAQIGPAPDALATWSELHRRALGWASGSDTDWLADFTRRVRCGECRHHWLALLKATPPTWSAYFAWTVAAHNAVNRRLGRPEIPEAEAVQIWGAKPSARPVDGVKIGAELP